MPRRWQVWISRSTYDLQEVPLHRDLGAVGQHEVRTVAELLDEAENVIPAAAVQSGGMIAQFVENLVHLESARGSSRSAPWPGCVPCGMPSFCSLNDEDVVPEAGFEVAFHLRQIEIRAGAALELRGALWKKNRPKSNSDAGDRLRHRPACASQCRCQPRGRTISVAIVVVQPVLLALGTGETDFAAHRVAQIESGPRCCSATSASSSPRNPP